MFGGGLPDTLKSADRLHFCCKNGLVEIELKSPINIKADLCRLARFGANISDSHSCFIFLPSRFLRAEEQQNARLPELELCGFHSLSPEILEHCRLPVGSGIIGWVAKHHQLIHVSPFEHDSRTLGMYRSDQKLKSFIGIPIPVDFSGSDAAQRGPSGVVACDSKKCYAFSKLQGKLLEDLAYEVANTLRLSLLCLNRQGCDLSYEDFLKRAKGLAAALGRNSVEVLRVHPDNFDDLEQEAGTSRTVAFLEQIYRLIQQALPPHFPLHRLPNGDILIVLDNMMGAFYQNKISAFAQHVARGEQGISFSYSKASFSEKRFRNAALEEVISSTNIFGRQPQQNKRTAL